MKLLRLFMVSALLLAALLGCRSGIPPDVGIQVNVPDEPAPGTRTHVVTFNVEKDRDVFLSFGNTAKRVGMCSPAALEQQYGAHEVMTISFWGTNVAHRAIFVLKNQAGNWLTAGYGGVEVYDDPRGFPQYAFAASAVARLKAWYEANVPVENRKR